MNPGQEKFFDFIIERVQADKVDQAKALLEESFSRQADGTFDVEYMGSFAPRLTEMLKPDAISEVKETMKNFAPK
jgi:hypothetical protein